MTACIRREFKLFRDSSQVYVFRIEIPCHHQSARLALNKCHCLHDIKWYHTICYDRYQKVFFSASSNHVPSENSYGNANRVIACYKILIAYYMDPVVTHKYYFFQCVYTRRDTTLYLTLFRKIHMRYHTFWGSYDVPLWPPVLWYCGTFNNKSGWSNMFTANLKCGGFLFKKNYKKWWYFDRFQDNVGYITEC